MLVLRNVLLHQTKYLGSIYDKGMKDCYKNNFQKEKITHFCPTYIIKTMLSNLLHTIYDISLWIWHTYINPSTFKMSKVAATNLWDNPKLFVDYVLMFFNVKGCNNRYMKYAPLQNNNSKRIWFYKKMTSFTNMIDILVLHKTTEKVVTS